MQNNNADLDELIREPRESLDIEVKDWLDLTNNDNRSALAKEIIALANHGGGYLIVGFEEQADGTFVPAARRPATLEAWSQDAIQSIIAKYVDPEVQCRVSHRLSPTGEPFPVIIVPGGHRLPIRAKAGSPDGKRLVTQRTYIRRAGPNSEEPRTAEEWDRLLERCLQARQTDLLAAMRSIMAGVIPVASVPGPSRSSQLRTFVENAIDRWSSIVTDLPTNSPPRFPHGFYEAAFAIEGDFTPPTLKALRDTIRTEVRNHSGWPPFLTISRDPFFPKPVDGCVECWIGPEPDGTFSNASHHDFWRISTDGLMFTRRGYSEDDGYRGMAPGVAFDISTPTWRLGEAILQASYVARAIGGTNANLICYCRWTGLNGRRLVSVGNPNRHLYRDSVAVQTEFEATETVAISALPVSLPETVYKMLAPLYHLFDFFDLPKRLVEQELADMQRHRF